MRWFFGALVALVLFAPLAAWAKPSRVVSLDYCADQFVLALADPEQIAAVSRGALRDDSYFRERARGLRQMRGTLEEALALRPDLVVRNWGGPWDAAQAFARFGVPVLQVGDATDFGGARANLLEAGRELDQLARAQALARGLDARLARLRAQPALARRQVMYLSAGGAVAGRGTMMDAAIRAGGGENVWGGESWSVLPLERLVETPPALLALGFFDHGRSRMNAWSPARHPALREMLSKARTVHLPAAAIACDAWFAIDAAERIANALRAPE